MLFTVIRGIAEAEQNLSCAVEGVEVIHFPIEEQPDFAVSSLFNKLDSGIVQFSAETSGFMRFDEPTIARNVGWQRIVKLGI